MRELLPLAMKLATVLVLFAAAAFAQSGGDLRGPVQPLPFSHKTHAGELSLECKTCHVNPDPGELMTYPANAICMGCHATVKTDSPAIQELAKAAAENRNIDWVRVYRVPDFVYFNHRTHLESGAACSRCHGDVPSRERIFVDGDITMGGCMGCHTETGAPIACNYCHEAF